MRRFYIPLLCITLCNAWPAALAQQELPIEQPLVVPPAASVQGSDNETVSPIQYPNNPVADILALYEKLTDKVLIRDASLASAGAISVVATKPMTKVEAIHLIEATLLLNGFTLVPNGGNQVKVIYTFPTQKTPRSEGVPLFDNAKLLPDGNEVVSYFMPMRFISSADALAIFKEHVVLHSFGQILEVPNAQAVVITENVPLIRELIDLQELIDVPPARVVSEFVPLKRADAERVADIISKLIEAQKSEKSHAPAAAQAAQQPGMPPGSESSFESGFVSGNVQLIPDARTNRILVVTRPANFSYIKNLIGEFDEEVGESAPVERPLKYVSASEVLPVLADLLQEKENGQAGQVTGGGGAQPGTQRNGLQQQTPQQQPYPGASGATAGASGGPQEPTDILQEPEDTGPTSIIVGKTHLIADNKSNSILIIGPPESQAKVRALLDDLDQRSPQVYLSTVIGQLRLINNNDFGIDYLKLFSANTVSPHTNGFAGSAMNTVNALVTPANLVSAAAFPATGGLSLYGTIGKNFSAYVHALEGTNRFKVLARPAIYTANNKKAVILSGQRVPYPTNTVSDVTNTGTSSTAINSSIAYQDVVLKLEVIPLINPNNEVNLKIAQVDDSISGSSTISANTVPNISTQKIVTNVTVPDGNTVVLGGLITETTLSNLTGIPILMHLPWIGPLFRDTSKSKERDELIIFMQPNVVHSNEDIVDASNAERDHAMVGKDSYQFAQPVPPGPFEIDSIFHTDPRPPKPIPPPPLPESEPDATPIPKPTPRLLPVHPGQ